MQTNNTGKILGIVGLVVSIFGLFPILCSCFFLFAGAVSYSNNPSDWDMSDNTAYVIFVILFCGSLLVSLIIGGLSIYALTRSQK